MAITLVGLGPNTTAGSGSVSLTLPAGTQLNDLIVVSCASWGTGTLACAGYATLADYANANAHLTVFWKFAADSEPAPIVTGAANGIAARTFVYRGVDIDSPWQVTDAGAPLTQGLISFLSANLANAGAGPGNNDDPTTVWADVGGAGHDGTIGGTAVWGGSGTPDDPHYLTFDGTTYVDLGDLSAAEDLSFSYGAWVRFSGNLNMTNIVSEGQSSGTNPFTQLGAGNAGNNQDFRFYLRSNAGAGTAKSVSSTAGNYGDGHWHLVFATCDGSLMKLYVDGASVGTPTAPPAGPYTLTQCRVGTKGYTTPSSYFFAGDIASVWVTSGALSAAQVATIYEAGPGACNGALSSGITFPQLASLADNAMVVAFGALGDNVTVRWLDEIFGNLDSSADSSNWGTSLGNGCEGLAIYGVLDTAGDIGELLTSVAVAQPWVTALAVLTAHVNPLTFDFTVAAETASEVVAIEPPPADYEFVVNALAAAEDWVAPTPTPPVVLLKVNPLLDGRLSLTVGGVQQFGRALVGWNGSDATDVAPGGDASLEFTVFLSATDDPFSLAVNHPELATDEAVSLDHGTTNLFTGQVCSDPTVGYAGEVAYVTIECDGLLAKAGRNGAFLTYWRDQSYDGWTLMRKSSKATVFDNVGRIYLGVPDGQTISTDFTASAYYQPHGGLSGQPIGYLTFDYKANLGNFTRVPSTYFSGSLSAASVYSDILLWEFITDFSIIGPAGGGLLSGTGETVAMPPDTYLVGLTLDYGGDATTLNFNALLELDNVTVHRGGQTFRVTGVSPTMSNQAALQCDQPHKLVTGDKVALGNLDTTPPISGAYTVRVSDPTTFYVPVHVLVSTSQAGYGCQMVDPTIDSCMTEIAMPADGSLATVAGAVGTVGSVLSEAIVRDPTTPADGLAQMAAKFSGRIDWGFRGGKWDCAPMLDPTTVAGRAAIRALPNCYLIDASVPGITYDVHDDPESSPDYVFVTYACLGDPVYPDGTVRGLYVPTGPPQAGDRVMTLDHSSESLNAAQAAGIGSQALLWYSGANSNNQAGTVGIAQPFVAVERDGTLVATPYLRSGDWLEEVHVKALDESKSLLYVTGRSIDILSGAVSLTFGGRGDEFNPTTSLMSKRPFGRGGGIKRRGAPIIVPKTLHKHNPIRRRP